MRALTVAETRKVLTALAHNRQGADMMLFDSICYGGQLEEYRDAKQYVERVIEAFPKDVRKAYDAELRKEQADELRAKADRVERGVEE